MIQQIAFVLVLAVAIYIISKRASRIKKTSGLVET
jgi:hypothetical protein